MGVYQRGKIWYIRYKRRRDFQGKHQCRVEETRRGYSAKEKSRDRRRQASGQAGKASDVPCGAVQVVLEPAWPVQALKRRARNIEPFQSIFQRQATHGYDTGTGESVSPAAA